MTDPGAGKEEFDDFAQSYQDVMRESAKGLGYDAYFDEYKIKEIARFLQGEGRCGDGFRFLNFGCGIGKSEPFIRSYFPKASICSVDLSRETVIAATQNNKTLSDVEFRAFDGVNIPFEGGFDVVLIANVLHHVPFDQHEAVAKSIYGKLNKNGLLFVFEHNPYNPITRKVVNACAFDKNAVLLKPGYCGRMLGRAGFAWKSLRFTLFFPNLLGIFRPLEKFLSSIPIGAQYYFVCRK